LLCATPPGRKPPFAHAIHRLRSPPPSKKKIAPHVADFYRRSLRALRDAGIPFLVGGAFSQACYTGIRRATKDLDLFILPRGLRAHCALMQQHGWRTEMTYPHWLAKVYEGDAVHRPHLQLGQRRHAGRCDRWFQGNCRSEVLGVPVHVANVEDSLLSKAFIMERERYDGGDIAHLLLANASGWTGPACWIASVRIGACCWPTWSCSAISIPASATAYRNGS
jgi:hypothetical protein